MEAVERRKGRGGGSEGEAERGEGAGDALQRLACSAQQQEQQRHARRRMHEHFPRNNGRARRRGGGGRGMREQVDDSVEVVVVVGGLSSLRGQRRRLRERGDGVSGSARRPSVSDGLSSALGLSPLWLACSAAQRTAHRRTKQSQPGTVRDEADQLRAVVRLSSAAQLRSSAAHTHSSHPSRCSLPLCSSQLCSAVCLTPRQIRSDER